MLMRNAACGAVRAVACMLHAARTGLLGAALYYTSCQHRRISGAAAGHLAAISALPCQHALGLTNLLHRCCLQDDLHEIMRLRKQAAEYQLAYYPSYGACAGESMSPSCCPAQRSLVCYMPAQAQLGRSGQHCPLGFHTTQDKRSCMLCLLLVCPGQPMLQACPTRASQQLL